MELTEKRNADHAVLTIRGRLDTTNYTQLEAKLTGMIDANDHKIIINCSEMDYVSSSGLRVLLLALKMITRVNGKFILCALKENIREIFEISGFTSIFTICPTEEDAVKAL